MSNQARFLNGYRIMWLMVMFDLPVTTEEGRKNYRKFRNLLLDKGFTMSQFSVYFKMFSDKGKLSSLQSELGASVPQNGHVQMISITDKQYEKIKLFYGASTFSNKKTEQLQLF